MENSQKRYWIVKVTENDKWQQAIEQNLWLTQQRYEHQKASAVTNLFNLVKQVKTGDCFVLGWKNKLYAYGTVIDCPYDSEQKTSLNKVTDTNSHEYDSGIVRFEDSTVFYENLENGTEDWGQRINVDKWHCYMESMYATTVGVGENVLNGISQMSIYEVEKNFAIGVIEKLRKQYCQNLTDYIDLLDSNRNLILTGAPGTGKTYLAKQVAALMILDKPYSDILTEEEKEIFEQHYKLVQFHPSYDYTDFVEGLRPTPPDTHGQIGFERKDGVFKAFCRRALTNEHSVDDRPFIFIIDEINRGEISKVFGELFFSIDPCYRGKDGLVQTQYQNMITDVTDTFYEGFYVPENVYIIGTMNDIDRSVECMDFAMRRRFAWMEVNANEHIGMLDALGSLKNDVIEKMRCLNNAIWNAEKQEGIEGLNSSYHIGGAYFKKLELYLNDDQSNHEEAYDKLWNNHLKGLLFEYLRGMFNANDELMKLKDAYDKCIKG